MCQLTYDGVGIKPDIESIPLSDVGLRGSWGNQIYRILLKSQPVAQGKWTYGFSAA